MARFRSAARLAPDKDVEIGGYVVGRRIAHHHPVAAHRVARQVPMSHSLHCMCARPNLCAMTAIAGRYRRSDLSAQSRSFFRTRVLKATSVL